MFKSIRTCAQVLLGLSFTAAAALAAESYPRVEFSGNLYLQYAWQTSPNGSLKAGTQGGYNGFDVTRSYLTAKSLLSDAFSAQITSDILRQAAGDTDVILRHAFVESGNSSGRYRFGLIPTLWTSYENSLWGYRVQGEPLTTRLKWFGLSDIGTAWSGGNQMVRYDVGIFNGEGRKQEAEGRKMYQGKVVVYPAKNLEMSLFASQVDPGGFAGASYVIGSLGYIAPQWRLGGMHALSRDTSYISGSASSVFGTMQLGNPQWEGLARWLHAKPNFKNSADERNIWIAGIAYKPIKGYTVVLDSEYTSYPSGKAPENVVALHTGYSF